MPLRKIRAAVGLTNGKTGVFSDSFLQELAEYAERNCVVNSGKPAQLSKTHCLSCLKAHALSIADKHEIDEEGRKHLEKLPFKTGHGGYYLDGEEIVEIG